MKTSLEITPLLRKVGIIPRRVSETELLQSVTEGRMTFKGRTFARISLKNYPHIDIRGANISRLHNLPEVIRSFDCEGCIVRGANLVGQDLRDARLARADLRRSNLSTANLSGANISKALLDETNLSYAVLDSVNAQSTSFRGANLFEASSIGGNFNRVNFAGANTTRFHLKNAKVVPLKPSSFRVRNYYVAFIILILVLVWCSLATSNGFTPQDKRVPPPPSVFQDKPIYYIVK